MGFLFKFWFYSTIFTLVVYTPMYFFANDDIDAIQEITAEDLMYVTGPTHRDYEKFSTVLEGEGIDISESIIDALDDNEHFSDVNVVYVEDDYAKKLPHPIKVVAITAKMDESIDFRLSFAVIPKKYAKNWTQLAGILSWELSRDGNGVNLLSSSLDGRYNPEHESYLFAMLSSNDKIREEYTRRIINSLPKNVNPSNDASIGTLLKKNPDDFNKAMNQYLAQPPVEPEVAESVEPAATQPVEPEVAESVEAAAHPVEQNTSEPMMSATALPFIGTRTFNFDGGIATEQSVTIHEDGRTVINACGAPDESSGDVERTCAIFYDGKFSSVINGEFNFYKIARNEIFIVDADGNRLAECNDMNEDCTAGLYE